MKKFLVLFFVLSFCVTTCVYAGNLVKKVYFSPYPILIDEEEYSSEMPILSYQDRTYVALREFSEMVGVEIDFKDETIIINTKELKSDNRNWLDNEIIQNEEKNNENLQKEEKNNSIDEVKVENIVTQKTTLVYITKSGTKYHTKTNCSNGNYYTVTIEEAIKNGYTSCKKCG